MFDLVNVLDTEQTDDRIVIEVLVKRLKKINITDLADFLCGDESSLYWLDFEENVEPRLLKCRFYWEKDSEDGEYEYDEGSAIAEPWSKGSKTSESVNRRSPYECKKDI